MNTETHESCAGKDRLRVLLAAPETRLTQLVLACLGRDFEVTTAWVNTPDALSHLLANGAWDLLLCEADQLENSCRPALKAMHEKRSELLVAALSAEAAEALIVSLLRDVDVVLNEAQIGRLVPVVARHLADRAARRIGELQALIQSSPDPMLIVDAEGRMLYANPLLERLLGYRAAELTGRSVELLVPEHRRTNHVRDRQQYLGAPKVRPMGAGIELAARHKNGDEIPVEISLGPVLLGGRSLVCCGVRDLRERKRAERHLLAILEGTAATIEDEYLRALVKNLTRALDVRYAFVSKFLASDPGRARMLAFWTGEAFAEEYDYALSGTPSEAVSEASELLVREDLQVLYPAHRRFASLAAKSFFGLRLQDGQGRPLGVLAIMDTGSYSDEANARVLMRIFAARAGAELDRIRTLASLKESEERFRNLTEVSNDYYWEQDAEFRFIKRIGTSWEKIPSSQESAIGKTRWELPALNMSEADWARHRADLDARLEFRDLEIARPLPSGETYWISTSGRPVFDANRQFVGYRGVGRNISERKHAEIALRDSERRYRQVLDNVDEIIYVVGVDPKTLAFTEVQFVSERVKAQLGYRPAEFLADPSLTRALIHPEDLPILTERTRALLSGAQSGVREYRIRHKATGEFLWMEDSVLPQRNAEGEVVSVFGVARDVTARKRAADEMQRFRLAMDASIDSIYLTDPVTMKFVDVNRAACLRLGHTREQLLALGPEDVLGRGRADISREYRELLAAGAEGVRIETRFIRADGGGGWSELHRKGLEWQGRQLVVTIGRDITERKLAEESLRESEERFRQMFELSVVGMAEGDPVNLRLLHANPCLCAFLGYSLEDLVGTEIRNIVHPEDWPMDVAGMQRLRNGEATHYSSEKRYIRKDGRVVWGEVHVSLLGDTAGSPHFVAAVVDITERVAARRQFQELTATLERRVVERTQALELANQELESFSFSVSHDLRAPLRAIGGYAEILKAKYSTELNAEAVRYLERIESNAIHMNRIVQGLLELARTSRAPLARVAVDMRAMAQAVSDELRETTGRQVAMRIGELPVAWCDPTLIHQVWQNLLGNAYKFSSHTYAAEIDVGFDNVEGAVAYYVRDNGAGFDMDYAHKLFGVFERLHTQAEFEGTGVGLATVHRILQRHGGRIWAEGETGRGAIFHFTLRLAGKAS